MDIQIDQNSMVPKHKQLCDQIEKLIRQGVWQEGHKLPSENQLQEKLNISRSTVRQALQAMESSGLIEKITGKGSFVRARQNRSGSLIGIIASNLNREYHHKILLGAEDTARQNGYNIIFGNSHGDLTEETEILNQFLAHNVKGIILWPAIQNLYHPEKLLAIRNSGIPVVVLDRIIPGVPLDTVLSDNFDGTYKASEFLIKNGHRKIYFITRPILSLTSISERYNGYRQAMEDNGLVPAEPVLVGEANREMTTEDFPLREGSDEYLAVSRFIRDQKPEAVVAMNDIMALNVMHIAADRGIRVPDQMSVVGFDRRDIGSSYRIPLTSVFQDAYRIGTESADLIFRSIREQQQEPQIIRLPVELVVRDSARILRRKGMTGT